MKTPICDLAEKYGSDKAPWGHNYTPVYWDLMCEKQYEEVNILEIGVLTGASIRMWLEFFPRSTVFALDVDEVALERLRGTSHRIIPMLGSQTDFLVWNSFPRVSYDFIIDDGSHIPNDQMRTFEENFHRVKSGGFWIIEDTHCMFHDKFNPTKSFELYTWFSQLILLQQMRGAEGGNFDRALNSGILIGSLTRMIRSIRSYKSLMIFERA